MTKQVFTGKTVDEAIKKATENLGVSADDLSVTVLEQPVKGFLGWFGAKEAKVEIEILRAASGDEEEPILRARRFLADIIQQMGLEADIEEMREKEDRVLFNVTGKELGLFIGRRGQTLDAVQLLINVYVNRLTDKHIWITLDAEQFRERRKKTLEDLSLRLASQVVRTRREVVLEPMPSHERRIIHNHLQQHPKVKTFSKGEEPNRRVVIALR